MSCHTRPKIFFFFFLSLVHRHRTRQTSSYGHDPLPQRLPVAIKNCRSILFPRKKLCLPEGIVFARRKSSARRNSCFCLFGLFVLLFQPIFFIVGQTFYRPKILSVKPLSAKHFSAKHFSSYVGRNTVFSVECVCVIRLEEFFRQNELF